MQRKYLVVGAVNGETFKYADMYREFFEPKVKLYTQHWGMEYRPFFGYPARDKHKNPNWMKHWMFLELFKETKEGDVISYIDADVMMLRGDIELTTTKDIGVVVNEAYRNTFMEAIWNNGVYSMRDSQFTREFVDRAWNNMSFEHDPCPDFWAWASQLKSLTTAQWDQHIEALPVELNVMSANQMGNHPVRVFNIPHQEIRFRHFANEHGIKHSREQLTQWANIPLRF